MSANPRKVFINLSVKDLERTMAFWRTLGFDFNMQFTNHEAACMVLSEEAYVMLLVESRFKDFTTQQICDTRAATECLIALSCESRAEVDELVAKAIAQGGAHAMPPSDLGFMYNWSFYDLDGHHWEVMWMDPSFVMPQAG